MTLLEGPLTKFSCDHAVRAMPRHEGSSAVSNSFNKDTIATEMTLGRVSGGTPEQGLSHDGLLHEYVKLLRQRYVFFVLIGDFFSDLFLKLDREQYNRSGDGEMNVAVEKKSNLHCRSLTVVRRIYRQTCVLHLSGVEATLR